jgi:hypothetical protein
MKTERTTIRMPSDLLKQARRYARNHNRTLTDVFQESVRNILDKPLNPSTPYRPAPVSSVKSNALVDLSNLAKVLDDLDAATPFEKLR